MKHRRLISMWVAWTAGLYAAHPALIGVELLRPRRTVTKKLILVLLGLAAWLGSQAAAHGAVEVIAYSSCHYDYWFTDDIVCGVAVVNADGSNTVVATVDGIGPVWAPDGSRLLFKGPGPNVFSVPGDVFVWNLADGTLTNLTNDPADDGPLASAPDGSKIAFWSDRDGAGAVYVMNVDGSAVTRLTDRSSPVSWSPNGDRIAFSCVVDSDNVDICVSNADGTDPVRLTTELATDAGPDWSPDGSTIAFWSDRTGQPALYVMNADGSGATPLVGKIERYSTPKWSPDGGRIAFNCRVEDPNLDICVVNADGTGFTRLTDGSKP